MTDGRESREIGRREVRIKPRRYQPSRAELEKPLQTDATPDEIADAILRPVRRIEDPAT